MKKAFTLIELMVVMMIMGLLGATMYPLLGPQIDKYRLESQAQRLLFDLKLTQQLSLTREDGYAYYGLKFYNNMGTKNNQVGYKILRYEPSTITPPIPVTLVLNPTVYKGDQPAENPIILEENLAFDSQVSLAATSEFKVGDRIIFTAEGSATSDGATLLPDTQNEIILASGNANKTITISPLTGYVKIN